MSSIPSSSDRLDFPISPDSFSSLGRVQFDVGKDNSSPNSDQAAAYIADLAAQVPRVFPEEADSDGRGKPAGKPVSPLKFVAVGVGLLAGAFIIARIVSIALPVLSLIALVYGAYKYRDLYFDKIFNPAEIAQIERYAGEVKKSYEGLMSKVKFA